MAYRKVLYRAKLAKRQTLNALSKENKQKYFADGWAYGFYVPERSRSIFSNVEPFASIVKTGDPKELTTGMWFDVKENTVGEFSGFTDKHGKNIFEGDIVEADGRREVVAFENGCFYPMGAYVARSGFEYDPDEYEVVGNIYDNPELLKEAK